ncbi:MAG: hypothetical protein EPN25_03215 [Nitrospirae bacterium]|nr:MAG: hypothetical protein EPN25_03215 [Nitrospirota bacterium]
MPFAVLLLFLLLGAAGCSVRGGLRTERVTDPGIPGNYTLVLHGCRYLDDPETIAFLDREGDGITFEPYTADFNYRTIKGLSAAEALAAAGHFVACNTSFRSSQISSIFAEKGGVLGYELRPLYLPYTYGLDDILLTDYRLRGERMVIRIRLDPAVENMLHGGMHKLDQ